MNIVGPENRKSIPRGFTALEILLVITILALACCWTAFHFVRQAKTLTLRGAAYSLYHTLRYARMIACQQHQTCEVEFDIAAGTFQIRILQSGIPVDSTSTPEARSQISDQNKIFHLPESIRFYQIVTADTPPLTSGVISIPFQPQGTSVSALIQICRESDFATIRIYPQTAQVEIRAGKIDALPVETIDLDKNLRANIALPP